MNDNEDREAPRDADHWANPIEELHVGDAPAEAGGFTVEGRQLTGPLQGFGQMWKKTYQVALEGADVTPQRTIEEWKQNYGDFWPPNQSFYAPLAGIQPGEIGLIKGGLGPAKMSTGVMVVYADDESFTFMNPEGHPWAGFITFSAHEGDEATVAQVSLLIRANDPIFEVGFKFFGGNRAEDKVWFHTLSALAAHFGVEAEPTVEITKVDPKRQWKNFGNVKHNALIGTTLHTLGAPFRALRRE